MKLLLATTIIVLLVVTFTVVNVFYFYENTRPVQITTETIETKPTWIGDSIPGTWKRMYKGDTLEIIRTVRIQYHYRKTK